MKISFLICAIVLGEKLKIKQYPLTKSKSASSNNNVIAICYVILTILQSLVGFNQPSTTQSRKTLGNDLVFVKSSKFESNNYISLCNFDEQQTFQLKTTINHANERDWSFQIQSFVLSVQFSNINQIYVKTLCRLCISFESECRLTHTNLRIRHQRHPTTTL